MKAALGLAILLVALAVVALNVRNQLRADRHFLPGASPLGGADAASAPFGGSSAPNVAQFQAELDKTLRGASERAASAGGAADAAP